jgi:outer membrane PBP1 activator LpoA protein
MAAVSRRPRTAHWIALALCLGAAACSLIKPEESPVDLQEQAARMVHEGKHAEAAQTYAQLASQRPDDHDSYELLSAEQWVAANNIAAAKQAFGTVSAEARTKMATPRALVAAEIAYAENDGARAIHELDQIPVPSAADQAQNYWWIRGRSSFLTGHPVEGTRALVERERYLTDTASLHDNREELLARVRTAAEQRQPLKPPPKTDPVVAGWLELGPVSVEMQRNPLHSAADLAVWQRAYPQHPADDVVLGTPQAPASVAAELPNQIALLLPLSGRAEAVGDAVRDGFIAAYLQQDAASRPRLKLYDVASQSISVAYTQAINDGAAFVVGPLTKDDVAAIAPLSNGRTPVLALNFLGDATAAPKNFYQFALLPEDEARIVARRVVADGRMDGVAIVPTGEWGARVAAAFNDELKLLGGHLLDSQRYDPSQADFADTIKTVMQVRSVKLDHKLEKGEKPEAPIHRTDAAFIFVAASSPAPARLILPQLRFHYCGDVPVYSTSDAFIPDPAANGEIDGLYFPDMPWMVSNDPVTAQIRDSVRAAWPASTARRDRLYAFGFDAYRLVPALRANPPTQTNEIAGVTGRLHVDVSNHVRRDLDWAQIKSGLPNAL